MATLKNIPLTNLAKSSGADSGDVCTAIWMHLIPMNCAL